MPISNLSSVSFTDPEVTSMNESLALQTSIINPKSTNLKPAEKTLYGSIAEQNKLVVQKVMGYMDTNLEIVPRHVDIDEFKRDSTARNQLDVWERQLLLLLNNIQNTKILLDYDVYQTTLTIYRNIRYLAKEAVPGMNAIYNDLQQFFPGSKTGEESITEESKA